ncbi:MerR family transcriptional regulator [Solirubrobacter sp. CPCC 204708]|uniref:MerR family transcriptional regulator n=1 Tax=Solirubrobacter deserti TaxID=2282478 RepID=A0ABT4RFY5_9ACTN|nr:MerR family transcriptional regulator [Solirubrobacter deserti]MBE2318176.1 MerR family transcriptional regulator [Solirubrobacter deserti]MDA0137457.1 MerR family transcriptional regulator [Solirubrobacter deserti]
MARPSDLIGAFARRVRLSPRQLRDYDELGLLAPAYVDPDSGYRYYHRGQVRSAITIGLLRSLDVPLPEIHALLVADEVAPLLERQRARVEAELERAQQALRALDRLIGSDELIPYAVVERDEPALSLTVLRGRCDAAELDGAAATLIGELPDGPVTGLYPLDLEGEVEFMVGVPGPGMELPAARVAVATHRGRYAELPLAYFALLAHAEERGRRPGAWVRERYLEAASPEAAVTEVLLPYE